MYAVISILGAKFVLFYEKEKFYIIFLYAHGLLGLLGRQPRSGFSAPTELKQPSSRPKD